MMVQKRNYQKRNQGLKEHTLKNLNDEIDKTIQTINEEKELPYSELTGSILNCFFDAMKRLELGFLQNAVEESVQD